MECPHCGTHIEGMLIRPAKVRNLIVNEVCSVCGGVKSCYYEITIGAAHGCTDDPEAQELPRQCMCAFLAPHVPMLPTSYINTSGGETWSLIYPN